MTQFLLPPLQPLQPHLAVRDICFRAETYRTSSMSPANRLCAGSEEVSMSVAETPPAPAPSQASVDSTEPWPREVELILSALEAARHDDTRRRNARKRYRARGELRLFSDLPGVGPWKLFTRDVSARGVG